MTVPDLGRIGVWGHLDSLPIDAARAYARRTDALRYGAPGAVTTYDLEGISTRTTIHRSTGSLRAGDPVTLSGATVDAAGVPVGAGLLLQARPLGTQAFRTVGDLVLADRNGSITLEVRPETTTDYRWYYPQSGQADAGWSPVVRVEVLPKRR